LMLLSSRHGSKAATADNCCRVTFPCYAAKQFR
jgi:hypothetical protein